MTATAKNYSLTPVEITVSTRESQWQEIVTEARVTWESIDREWDITATLRTERGATTNLAASEHCLFKGLGRGHAIHRSGASLDQWLQRVERHLDGYLENAGCPYSAATAAKVIAKCIL